MKIKMLTDTAARVQVRKDVLDKITRKDKGHNGCGGHPVSHNGCWIVKGAGGWATIAAFGGDAQAEEDLIRDLEALAEAESSN
jgi:hypothetical protein